MIGPISTRNTAFSRLLGCGLPVQQAPMGAVAGATLAAAVADAGGVGMISGTGCTAAELQDCLARRSPDLVLGVNFAGPVADLEAVAVAAAACPLVDFFWSNPSPTVVAAVHAGGSLACWQVGSVAEARLASDAGVDIIAVQGCEAGGHVRGYWPLAQLLEQVLDAVDLPILAAGGITTAHDVSRALRAGAAGVRIGTRLLATREAAAHPRYKEALVKATPGSTVITDAFADCPLCRTVPRARVLAACLRDPSITSGRPPDRSVRGNIEAMALYAGEGVGTITSILPAADVLAELFPETSAN